MTTVLLIIQLIICIVLIGLILIQKSEGGALGIGGGGGGGGGLMSGRSSANAVTRATTILGTAFLLNCVLLSIFFGLEAQDQSRTAVNPTEQGLTIDPESSNSDAPLADEILATETADDAAATEPDAETANPDSANTEETQSPE